MSGVVVQLVPEGYQRTEVGVIPCDWGFSDIQAISSVPMQNGLFYEPARKGKGIGIINVGDLYKSAPIDLELLELFDATKEEMKVFKVAVGDLFFTRSSIVPSGIAHCNIHYPENKENKVVFDSHLIRVRVNSKENDPRYIYLACLSRLARNHLIGSAKTATMTTIDQGAIKKCPVLIPSRKEQTAIANALSDVDALITSLDKLITKKRAIKTAAMQQLLTGKKRLPPFDQAHTGYKKTELGEIPEDWEVVALNNICSIMTGNTPSTNKSEYYGEEYLFVSPADLHGQKYIKSAVKKLTQTGFNTCRKYPKASILFTCIGSTIGKCGIAWDKLTSNQQINAVLPSDKVDMDYLYYQLLYTAPVVKQQAGEQAVPIVNKTQFGEHLVLVPNDRNEQKAVSSLLSDMDSELEILGKRLTKTQNLKQGMMQELLTGRTRLV
ncbi:MAG: restriction endonuclease subunit S [Motiliproteus sp.]